MRGSAPLLAIQHLSVRFGEVAALEDVSLEVGAGSVCGLIGPNGSGKTTLVNTVMGQIRCREGCIEFDGARLDTLPSHRRRSLGMSRTFQNLELSEALTIRESLRVGVQGLHLRHRELEEEVRRCSALLGLERHLEEVIGRLPYGVRKQVEVARALMGAPRLVILDEAAAGLNSHAKRELVDVLARAAVQAENPAMMVIEHDMAFLQQLVSSVTVLDAGRVVASGAFDDVVRDEGVREAYLGAGLPSNSEGSGVSPQQEGGEW